MVRTEMERCSCEGTAVKIRISECNRSSQRNAQVERRGQAPRTAGTHRDVIAFDPRRWGQCAGTRAGNESASQVHLVKEAPFFCLLNENTTSHVKRQIKSARACIKITYKTKGNADLERSGRAWRDSNTRVQCRTPSRGETWM